MLARRFLPILSLLVVLTPSALGQLPKRVEGCLPYPTLVQEIGEMQAPEKDPSQVAPESEAPQVRVHVARVEFKPENDIPASVRNRGRFYRAMATAKLTVMETKGADIDVAATIRATPGTQHRTGEVRFESADDDVSLGISAEVLRGLIPLQSGELFSAEKVRMGVENLTRAYSREDYVDMVPEPKTAIDEGLKTIGLVYRIYQGEIAGIAS